MHAAALDVSPIFDMSYCDQIVFIHIGIIYPPVHLLP